MVECFDRNWSEIRLLSRANKDLAIVKPCASQKVEFAFFGTKIKVTTEVRRYLGGSLGTQKFKDLNIKGKFNEWIGQLEFLSKIAAIEPQSAYCAFTAGFKHKVTYTMRTIPDICQHLQKLDQYVEKSPSKSGARRRDAATSVKDKQICFMLMSRT